MQNLANPIYARLRFAGMFIILGLVIQALSLLWNHPLSFIAFVILGGLLQAIGIALYLLTVVNVVDNSAEGTDAQPRRPHS